MTSECKTKWWQCKIFFSIGFDKNQTTIKTVYIIYVHSSCSLCEEHTPVTI